MKTLIGGREVIATFVLQVPKGEQAYLEFRAGTWEVRLNVKFTADDDKSKQSYKLAGEDGIGTLTFGNWDQAILTAIPNPLSFGETDGRKVIFFASGHSVQGFTVLNLTFAWEN